MRPRSGPQPAVDGRDAGHRAGNRDRELYVPLGLELTVEDHPAGVSADPDPARLQLPVGQHGQRAGRHLVLVGHKIGAKHAQAPSETAQRQARIHR